MIWSKERVKQLEQLWGSGLTAQQIAEIMGDVTRNAIIGKANRMKLSRNNVEEDNLKKKTKSSKKVGSSIDQATSNAKNILRDASNSLNQSKTANNSKIKPEALNLVLLELTDSTCKWPVSDPGNKDYFFCGVATENTGPYCAYHASKAFTSSRGRNRNSA